MRFGAILATCLLVIPLASASSGESEEPAREAAKVFGRALTSATASKLRPILPQRGKIYLSLSRLGPEEGSFGAGQVEVLFGDFLAAGSVRSFDVVRMDTDGRSRALVHARVQLVDRQGRSGRVLMHLALEPEGDRWVLREIKETAE